jgi:Protein of unknown function (DUF2794)
MAIRRIPQKKKDQLSLVQCGVSLAANRPDPDDPGGLGAEESGAERTGPTQVFVVAIQRGGGLAEIGPYYDSANDLVTGVFRLASERVILDSPCANLVATALLQPPAVGAIMWHITRRRSMSSMSEEADPSEARAAVRNAAAGPQPGRVTFNRLELSRILNLYGRMVADGEWRDYAIDFLRDRAVFSVFRRASEVPIYRIEKDPRLARKQGMYSVISATGLILRRGHELDRVLLVIDRKLAVV